jgi:hypothetical protein
MNRKLIIIFVLLGTAFSGWTQNPPIHVHADNQYLNTILIQLRDQYGFQLSYNDSEVSKYRVTVSKTFPTGEEALEFLLQGLPFQLKKSGEVFIIVPVTDRKKQREETQNKNTHISGQIVEAGSYEPLPFSYVIINNHPVTSDVTGNFNFTASADASFHLKILHLGYYIYDTILYSGINQKFKLKPSVENLPEVEIRENLVDRALQVGIEPGKMKINHNIARFLPGQGDNSIFNLLRLVPGIQAAGEQTTDLLIWGSYEGQSLITLDGFTLFGLKNYNDNISVVNPFWVKNIEIYKGGYDARFGNRVGGLVNMTGKNGNREKPVFSFNINQTTLNGMAELPLFKNSSLMAAYRQTYYNLYNLDDFNVFAPTRPYNPRQKENQFSNNSTPDISVTPDKYRFRDFNIKYSINLSKNDQFYVSLYSGGDNFDLAADAVLSNPTLQGTGSSKSTSLKVSVLNHEVNKQLGYSVFYNKIWGNGHISKIIASHSEFSKKITDFIQSEDQSSGAYYNQDTAVIANEAKENSLRMENIINLKDGHQIEFGAGIYGNNALIEKRQVYKNNSVLNAVSEYQNNRGFAYFQDNLPVNRKLFLKSGLRVSLVDQNKKIYTEPRLSAGYQFSENLKASVSWGMYNQFMYKSASVDRDNNYSYLWVTGNSKLPVLQANHWVSGFNYSRKGLTVNIDAYYKTTKNLTRQIFLNQTGVPGSPGGYTMVKGDARIFGIDMYVKKDFGHHSVWASYTLSKADERLTAVSQQTANWEPAPQDQRHELKLAALFNIGNFHLSTDYVYGSGMEILKQAFKDESGSIRYNRIDAAVTYKFPFKKLNAETGLSVLNVLDTRNLKASNLKNIFVTNELGSVKIYTDAVPFTPTLFLKIVF